MWRIEFNSSLFLPTLPSECQVNPGVFGHELAVWLGQALLQRGITTSYPVCEDWGWVIECNRDEQEVQIGCASMSDDGEGYDGQPITWSIFVKPHRPMMKLFNRAPAVAAPTYLTTAIASVLAAPGIVVRLVES